MTLALPATALEKLWPHAPHSLIDGMVATSESVFAEYGIRTVPELVDLMAQGSEETGGGTAIEENLHYSATRMCQVWPSRFPTLASAAPYANNPRALADCVYGSRYGNRKGSDDGYNFRGRGFIQVTFRSWYEKLSSATGLDLVSEPDLVNDPQHFLEVACAFWKLDNINAFADKGDFRGETLRLNGGYTNMATRLQWRANWARELAHLQVAAKPTIVARQATPIAVAPAATPPSLPQINRQPGVISWLQNEISKLRASW